MSSGHFLNGFKCQNCKHSWWEFDPCCADPIVLVNPRNVARYGNEGPWEKPKEKIDSAIESLKTTLKKLEDAR